MQKPLLYIHRQAMVLAKLKERKKMNKVFQIHFDNDEYCDLKSELFEVAQENGWTVRGSVKIEFLDEMIKLAKEKAERFETKASIHIYGTRSNGGFDPSNKIDSYEV